MEVGPVAFPLEVWTLCRRFGVVEQGTNLFEEAFGGEWFRDAVLMWCLARDEKARSDYLGVLVANHKEKSPPQDPGSKNEPGAPAPSLWYDAT